MDKTYNPQDIEQSLYQDWEQKGYFKPSGQGVPYSIMIPPPNVTGSLHMTTRVLQRKCWLSVNYTLKKVKHVTI